MKARSKEELRHMRAAGRVVAEMHEKIRAAIRPGVTTADLDSIGRKVIDTRGATSNFLGYHGFPAVICASPNDVIVHGIPGAVVLNEGDIISVDCGAVFEFDAEHGVRQRLGDRSFQNDRVFFGLSQDTDSCVMDLKTPAQDRAKAGSRTRAD